MENTNTANNAKSPAKPERKEIATVARDITYPAFSGLLRQNDDTLLQRGQGKGLKLYDEIERDCYAYAVLQKRKMAVIARPWEVEPASSSRLDKKAADLVRAQIEAMDFDHICMNLLDALLKGFAVGEVMWDVMGSEIVCVDVKPRDQRRFTFGEDFALRLLTPQAMTQGEELPERKFMVHSFGAKDGSPWGLGLGTRLFWPVFFKRQDISFWLTFADKFASPTAIGKYPQGTDDSEQSKLLRALAAISREAGITVPTDYEVELLEASRSGAVTYEDLARYLDEQIAYTVLGEAAGAKDSGGALASAAILRNEVRLELVQADSDLLSSTLNKTLCAWLTQYNVPNANPPRVWRQIKAPEDRLARAEADKVIFDMGFKPSLEYIHETYGGEWVETKAAEPVTQNNKDASFAENENRQATSDANQDALDQAIDALPADEIDGVMREMLKPVIAALRKGTDAEQAAASLADLYPQMDTEQLELMLTRAIFVADLLGRYAAQQEVSNAGAV